MPDLSAFIGNWAIDRNINDHLGGPPGKLIGTATFTHARNGVQYVETGLLQFEGRDPLQAERRYLWHQKGDLICVEFSDGAEFHNFSSQKVDPVAHHHCAPDDYIVTYGFAHFPKWKSHWRVKGPRKDYEMTTTYTLQR